MISIGLMCLKWILAVHQDGSMVQHRRICGPHLNLTGLLLACEPLINGLKHELNFITKLSLKGVFSEKEKMVCF